MSRLRAEEKEKKELQGKNDTLLEIGKEGKEGDKAFRQYAKEKDTESKTKRDNVLNMLDGAKKKYGYHYFLSGLLLERMKTVDWPIGWGYQVGPTKDGVIFEMKSPDGRTFRRAFRPTRDPILDLNAIETYALRAENTIDRITGADRNRIILP